MLLIDGYNLLHACHRSIPHEKFEAMREDLVRRVGAFAVAHNQRVTICFDGGKRGAVFKGRAIVHSERVTVVFSPKGRTADDEMIARLRETKDRTAYTVVSADRAITDEAAKRKFKIVAPKDFADMLPDKAGRASDPRREGITSAEADAWMREFGIKG